MIFAVSPAVTFHRILFLTSPAEDTEWFCGGDAESLPWYGMHATGRDAVKTHMEKVRLAVLQRANSIG